MDNNNLNQGNINNNVMPTQQPMQNQPIPNINYQQPLNQNAYVNQATGNIQNQSQVIQNNQVLNQSNINNVQQEMKNIPIVDQNKQDFINNAQIVSKKKKEEKKDNGSILFVIILFAIIFASVFFLFPYLLEFLG